MQELSHTQGLCHLFLPLVFAAKQVVKCATSIFNSFSSNNGKQVTQFCNPFDYTLSQFFLENIQITQDPECNNKLLLFTALRYQYTGEKRTE